jgi:hypothetical protein
MQDVNGFGQFVRLVVKFGVEALLRIERPLGLFLVPSFEGRDFGVERVDDAARVFLIAR